MQRLDLRLQLVDPPIKLLEVAEQPLNVYAKGPGQLVAGVLDQIRDSRGNVADALGNNETELTQKATDLIRLCRTRLHEALTPTAGLCASARSALPGKTRSPKPALCSTLYLAPDG